MDDAKFYFEIIKPIELAIESDDLEKFKVLWTDSPECHNYMDYGCHGSALHYAASLGKNNICEYLLETGVDVNYTNKGATPLESAAVKGNLKTAQFLVENGAFVDGLPETISPPLSSAITFGHSDIAFYLMEKGADVNRLHLRQNTTPLDTARAWGRVEIAKKLETVGALSTTEYIDFTNEFGGSILRYVHEHAGTVLPITMRAIVTNDQKVEQHLAIVNKNKSKYLFTIGLFTIHKPMLELFIVLESDWNMLNKSAKNQFPSELLLRLSSEIKDGLLIDETYLISSTDDRYSDLNWPENIAGFYPVDFKWSNEPEEDIPEDETVTLLTLMPIKKTKSGKVKPADVEKNRKAKWGKLTLKI